MLNDTIKTLFLSLTLHEWTQKFLVLIQWLSIAPVTSWSRYIHNNIPMLSACCKRCKLICLASIWHFRIIITRLPQNVDVRTLSHIYSGLRLYSSPCSAFDLFKPLASREIQSKSNWVTLFFRLSAIRSRKTIRQQHERCQFDFAYQSPLLNQLKFSDSTRTRQRWNDAVTIAAAK